LGFKQNTCSSYQILYLNFCDRYSQNTQISNLVKIQIVGLELLWTVRQTDEADILFLQSCKYS
jgi:hypothetical protein